MASTKKAVAKSGKSTRVETKKPVVKKVAKKASVTAAKKKAPAKVVVKKAVKTATVKAKVAAKPTAKKTTTKVTTKTKLVAKNVTAKKPVKAVSKAVKKVIKPTVTKTKATAKIAPVKKVTIKKVVKAPVAKAKATTKPAPAKKASLPAKKTTTSKVVKKAVLQPSKVKVQNTIIKSAHTIKNNPSEKSKPKVEKKIESKKSVAPKVIAEKTSTAKRSNVKLIKTAEEGKQMVETIDTPTSVKDHTEMVGKSNHMIAGIEGLEPYKPIENESYMSEGQVKHFRLILESMRQQLMEDVDRTVNDMRDSDKNLSDFTDRATNEEEMFFMLRTRTREGKLLKKIEEALDRLEHQDYGFCDSCGVEIGIRRLEARPTTTLCIDCKTLDEIREKQRGG